MAFYSQTGRERIAKIIRDARGGLSYREFAEAVGDISHGTIARIEQGESDPSDKTLLRLAKFTPYSYIELKRIAQDLPEQKSRRFVTAEDVYPVAAALKPKEVEKLINQLVRHLTSLGEDKKMSDDG